MRCVLIWTNTERPHMNVYRTKKNKSKIGSKWSSIPAWCYGLVAHAVHGDVYRANRPKHCNRLKIIMIKRMQSIFALISELMGHGNCTKCHMDPMSIELVGCSLFSSHCSIGRSGIFSCALAFWKIHERYAGRLQVNDVRNRFRPTLEPTDTQTHANTTVRLFLAVCPRSSTWIIDGNQYRIPFVLWMIWKWHLVMDATTYVKRQRNKKCYRRNLLVYAPAH